MLLCCGIIICNPDIFLFTCRFIIVTNICNSCGYVLWEFSIDMVFLFLFSSPNLLIFDMSILFHGTLHHASIVPRYVSIVVAFVTFNIIVDTSIPFLSISCISSTIYSLMSKIVARKTITRKEKLILGSKGSSFKWRSLRWFLFISWLIMIF